jgi:NIPSNAP
MSTRGAEYGDDRSRAGPRGVHEESRAMFTCVIRYQVEPGKRDEFKEYARAWISLIRKYGGTHHGYFVPGAGDDEIPRAGFSFPGLGKDGPPNVAMALFSFPTVEAYDSYRKEVAQDPGCEAATARFGETKCFSSYERTFLVPIFE